MSHEDRGPNFLPQSISLIADRVMEQYSLLYGEDSQVHGRRTIQNAWEQITLEVNDMEAYQRKWIAVRKRWEDSKRMARRRCMAIMQAGKSGRPCKMRPLDDLDKRILHVSLPDLYEKWQRYEDGEEVADVSTGAEESSDTTVEPAPKRPRTRCTKRVVKPRPDAVTGLDATFSPPLISSGDTSVGSGGDADAGSEDSWVESERVVSPSPPHDAASPTGTRMHSDSSTSTADDVLEGHDPHTTPVLPRVGYKEPAKPANVQDQMVGLLQKLVDGQQAMQMTLREIADGLKSQGKDMSSRMQDVNVANIETGKKVKQLTTKMGEYHREHMSVLSSWCGGMSGSGPQVPDTRGALSLDEGGDVAVVTVGTPPDTCREEAGPSQRHDM